MIDAELNHQLPPASSFFPQRVYNPDAALCFVHIAKAAGTSVRLMMENAFPGDLAYPAASKLGRGAYAMPRLAQEAGDHLQAFKVLSGHFGVEVAELLHPDANLFTWLREPADRTLSDFFFFVVQERQPSHRRFIERLDRGERLETVFLDWLVEPGPDFHRQQAQLVFGKPSNFGDWRAAHPALSLTEAAILGLRRCFFFGLMEDQSRSVDAFCVLTSILPPQRTERRNRGTSRPKLVDFTADEQARFEAVLEPERKFYALAREVYDAQMARLAARAATEPAFALIGDREALRRHILDQAVRTTNPLSTWHAWDPILGENLDSRELLKEPGGNTSRWRWTGNSPDTRLYFRLPRTTPFDLHIRLNSATPPEHANHVTLRLAGKAVPLNVSAAEDGKLVLTATVGRSAAIRLPDLAELHLHTALMLDESKIVPYAGTRMLGLAIESISVEPIPLRAYLWHRLKQTRGARFAQRLLRRLRRGA